MAKAKKEKTAPPSTPSKRANKYQKKLKVNTSFEELIKLSVTPGKKTK